MNDSPLLSKMDALMKKHRGSGAPAPDPSPRRAPPPGAWLPVLTDVIERGTPPGAKVSAAPAVATPARPAPAEDDVLAEQVLCELTPRLSEAMEKQVAEELRKRLDHTVASLLGKLDLDVRDLVRDAVAEKLKQPRDPSS
jgi:hypothetical protein